MNISKAELIAQKAHEGQVDKAGEEEIMVALLHDVVEDSEITQEQLKAEGFSDTVLEALDAISKRESESYDDFTNRVKENPIARDVKLADLKDNMDILRLPALTETDLQRVAKYHKAYRYLEQFKKK